MLLRALPVLNAFLAVRCLTQLTSHEKLNRHFRLYAGPPPLPGLALVLGFVISVRVRSIFCALSGFTGQDI
jgi:hypothetical protein